MGRGVEEVMVDGTCKNGWEKGMTNRCREIEQKGERFGFGWVEKFLWLLLRWWFFLCRWLRVIFSMFAKRREMRDGREDGGLSQGVGMGFLSSVLFVE